MVSDKVQLLRASTGHVYPSYKSVHYNTYLLPYVANVKDLLFSILTRIITLHKHENMYMFIYTVLHNNRLKFTLLTTAHGYSRSPSGCRSRGDAQQETADPRSYTYDLTQHLGNISFEYQHVQTHNMCGNSNNYTRVACVKHG